MLTNMDENYRGKGKAMKKILAIFAVMAFSVMFYGPKATEAVCAGQTFGSHAEFNSPQAVAVDASGNVFVADTSNNRVVEFSPSSGTWKTFGYGPGGGTGQFTSPCAIAVDASGNVFVMDQTGSYPTYYHRIVEFNPSNFLGTWKAFSGFYYWNSNTSIAVDASGNVWLAEGTYVEELNPSTGARTTFGSSGHGTGQFQKSWYLAVDASGNIWVADTGNNDNRIDEFNPSDFSGTWTAYVNLAGTDIGQLYNPEGVTEDATGNVWVADTSDNQIDEFNPSDFSGTWKTFSTSGAPYGIAVDNATGNVWVAEGGLGELARPPAHGPQ